MSQSNKVLEKVASCLKEGCIITGGHFRILFINNVPEQQLNAGTIKSFNLAVRLYLTAIKRNIMVYLGLLINDMGSSCNEEGCYLKSSSFSRENYRVPNEYMEILSSYGLENYPIKIFWEKHIRNRSKKELLKILKKSESGNLVKERSNIFLIDPENYGKIILTHTMGKDKYGTPACPLIMAGLNIEQSKFYSAAINFYYIGDDNIINIPNYFVIEKGKRVAEVFGCKMDVKNLYFDSF